MSKLDQKYWQERYLLGDTPWDTGSITIPIQHFIDQLSDRQARILIPGAGKAHEAIYLFKNGFINTYVCDWSSEAFQHIRQQVPDFPESNLICNDFFKLDLKVDLILEQTFFCAIPRELRSTYVSKSADLLQDNGQLAGLLFAQEFPFEGPPSGGSEEEYRDLFSPVFEIETMKLCENSIKPRAGRELFIQMTKK